MIARQLNGVLKSEHLYSETLLNGGFDKVDYIEARLGAYCCRRRGSVKHAY